MTEAQARNIARQAEQRYGYVVAWPYHEEGVHWAVDVCQKSGSFDRLRTQSDWRSYRYKNRL